MRMANLINISPVCEHLLREILQGEQERKWREEYADLVAVYKPTVDVEGLPLQESRSF